MLPAGGATIPQVPKRVECGPHTMLGLLGRSQHLLETVTLNPKGQQGITDTERSFGGLSRKAQQTEMLLGSLVCELDPHRLTCLFPRLLWCDMLDGAHCEQPVHFTLVYSGISGLSHVLWVSPSGPLASCPAPS